MSYSNNFQAPQAHFAESHYYYQNPVAQQQQASAAPLTALPCAFHPNVMAVDCCSVPHKLMPSM